jgi:hypothetical protein
VVRPGRGRKPSIPAEKVKEIVHATLHEKPPGRDALVLPLDGQGAGCEPGDGAANLVRTRHQAPPLKTFKLSNDKRFEEKLVDVVGLYLNPPEKAIVLCMDEKSQIQALDRTQASLPMKKGRAGTMTHDYKRNGTTTLFAALDVLTGSVIGECLPRHRHIRVPEVPAHDRPRVPNGLRDPPDPRQLLNPQARERQEVAREAPPLSPALHANIELVAEPDRAMVRQAHRQGHPPRRLPQRPRPDRRHRAYLDREQREPQAIHLDRSPPTRSSRRSDAAASPSMQSPTKTETLH